MIFASADSGAGGVHFQARELGLLSPEDFGYQSGYHISVTDEARGRIIKRAWDLRLAIVEVHSHVGRFASAEFSSSDRGGLVRGAPYAALVVTEDAFDALVWAASDEPEKLEHIRVGDRTLAPTSVSHRRWRYDP
jgi:hypothetical protein